MKYKRSLDKMMDLLAEISAYDRIQPDTKAILLVLAATMSIVRYNRLVDNIEQIDAIRARLQALNVLRHQYGREYRDYILLYALQSVFDDVSSQEILQLIS